MYLLYNSEPIGEKENLIAPSMARIHVNVGEGARIFFLNEDEKENGTTLSKYT